MSYINRKGKNSAWRNRVSKNLIADMIIHEKLVTSLTMSIQLTKLVSKLIEWGKTNDLHSRRLALRYLVNKKYFQTDESKEKQKILDKLFLDLGQRYKERQGGYSRVRKLPSRMGDNSPRFLISLV
jgi:large subunit ribosomal protein L17